MKRIYAIVIILPLMLAIWLWFTKTHAAEVEIDHINVNQPSDSSLWAIKGIVRNLENHPIKGYVKIKFLNVRGHVFKAAATGVNDSKPVGPGESGGFEYRAFKRYFGRAADFQVIFVEVEIKEPREPLSPVLR